MCSVTRAGVVVRLVCLAGLGVCWWVCWGARGRFVTKARTLSAPKIDYRLRNHSSCATLFEHPWEIKYITYL
ncbi:hypothetical protein E2C01_074210 [Portunus trituberculatus]|uniref:Uncharacterized protein n=1 Tax=Portunus trituberculatus TaxID=210409 RepID=A0A5B7IBK7_PORTR|nr:hypothetical protein [Portunus trituberculatus]